MAKKTLEQQRIYLYKCVCCLSVFLQITNINLYYQLGTNTLQLTDVEGKQTDKVRLKCSISHRKKFQRGHVS